MDLTYIFRTFHPKTAEYTFFSSAHGMFSKIDPILGHKSALSKYKKIEIIPCIFSDHNAMKLEIDHKKKFGNVTNTWRLKNILLKNECANQEVKEEIIINFFKRKLKNIWKPMKMITPQPKTSGTQQGLS